MKNIALLILALNCVLAPFLLRAQDFQYKTDIEEVPEKAFYEIALAPVVIAKLNPKRSDIRIFDDNNTEIPYLRYRETPSTITNLFREYEIIDKEHRTDWGYTRLVIHNPAKTTIDNISLIIKNADVQKWLKLNASNDRQNWYVLKDNYRFHSVYNENGTSEIRVINFPPSDYEYYELLISDWNDRPINILKAGYYVHEEESGKYTQLPQPRIRQTNNAEEKISRITVSFPEIQSIDRIEIQVEGPTYFLRHAELQLKDSIVRKNQPNEYYYANIQPFNITSFNQNTIVVDKLRAQTFYIEIRNEDNQPLKITGVKAYQLNNYLIAELDKDQHYEIYFGNTVMELPKYDLRHFKDSISHNLPQISHRAITPIETPGTDSDSIFSSAFIWISIGLVIIILGYMSMRMLSEMKKEK